PPMEDTRAKNKKKIFDAGSEANIDAMKKINAGMIDRNVGAIHGMCFRVLSLSISFLVTSYASV
ncbi:MAG: hypothetical protein D6735_07600, partial [Acidobacteria bacterium]